MSLFSADKHAGLHRKIVVKDYWEDVKPDPHVSCIRHAILGPLGPSDVCLQGSGELLWTLLIRFRV